MNSKNETTLRSFPYENVWVGIYFELRSAISVYFSVLQRKGSGEHIYDNISRIEFYISHKFGQVWFQIWQAARYLQPSGRRGHKSEWYGYNIRLQAVKFIGQSFSTKNTFKIIF